MAKIKEGFKGERLVSLPDELLESYHSEPLISNLYVRKIGYFPRVKYHFVRKDKGCDYAMLIYCTEGCGWYELAGKRYAVERDQYIILPPGVPYSFGADEREPWTIYWLHFNGALRDRFVPAHTRPVTIEATDRSRLQDRLRMFEELFGSFSMGYIKEYMIYASMCLYGFLASFLYIEPFRHIVPHGKEEYPFAARVTHYMREKVGHSLTLDELAAHFRYSPSHFSALFRQETGFSPMSYFIRMKIQRACEYIELTSMRMGDIAICLGFYDPAYFARAFTKIMGCSHSTYRQRERMAQEQSDVPSYVGRS